MKIIAIASSPRGTKSQTLKLTRALARGVRDAGGRIEVVDIAKLRIEYCRACDACHRTGRCVHKDDFEPLRKKLLAAEGIVLSSPDYFRSVSAQLKTMIDRMADAIHCQLLAGKYACSLATSGGPAAEEVTTYLNGILMSMGAWAVGSVAASAGRGDEATAAAEQKAFALGRELVSAIAAGRSYPGQAEQHKQNAAYFKRVVEFNKDRWPHEYDFWSRVG